jgi:hypothetical protein
LCLSPQPVDLDFAAVSPPDAFAVPPRIELQRLRAKALQAITFYRGSQDLADIDAAAAASRLKADPTAFCAELNPSGSESRLVTWRWPGDLRQAVMVPPGHFLSIVSDTGFRARLVEKDRALGVENSIPAADGSHFCLFLPRPAPKSMRPLTLQVDMHTANGAQHEEASLLLLPRPEDAHVRRVYGRSEFLQEPMRFLSTNGSGAMLRTPVAWGHSPAATTRCSPLI